MRVYIVSRGSPDARAGLALVMASLLFHLPAWASGRIPLVDDVRVFYFPLLVATSTALSQGTLPFWTPSVFGGYPLFADGEAGMLYPLHLLLLPWLAPEVSLVVLRIVHSALASIFTYAFLRTLGVGRVGSVIGGIVYAYSGFAAGQIVHSNLFHSLTWLPLALALIERSCQTSGTTRYRYAVLAGAVFGVQGLATHIQVTFYSALIVMIWLAYRGGRDAIRVIRSARQRSRRVVDVGVQLALVGIVGGGLSAVQLLPLYELSTQSYRGAGLEQALAATNSIWPGGLSTLLFPALFDTPQAGFWGPWVKWETTLYVGILPLALAAVGLFGRGGRHRWFFGMVALVALWLTLGPQAPIPLWALLHNIPGFDVFKSPGRFGLLLTLAVAVLAGYGVDNLLRGKRERPRVAAAALIGMTSLVGGLGLGMTWLSNRLRTDGTGLMEAYLNLTGIPDSVDGAPFTVEHASRLAADALATTNPSSAWQLLLLGGAGLILTLWLLGPRVRGVAVASTLALVLADFAVLWLTYHPYGAIADLRPILPPPLLQASGELSRTFTVPTALDKVTQMEPNLLLTAGLHEAWGYSSIEPSRQIAYAAAAQRTDNHLLDLWNVRYLIRRAEPQLLPSYAQTSFLPERPLLSSRRGNPGSVATWLPDGGRAHAEVVHVVAALRGAAQLEDGAQVARVVLRGPDGQSQTIALRAGRDVSDRAIGVGIPMVHHEAATVAYQFQRGDPLAPNYREQLFFARLPLTTPFAVESLTVDVVAPMGRLEIFGLGLWDSVSGEVTQVRQNAKYRLVHHDPQLRVFENTAVAPRAFLVHQAVVLPVGRDALSWMNNATYDALRTIVVESPLPAGTTIESLGPGAVRWPSPPAAPTSRAEPDASIWATALPPAPRPREDAAHILNYQNEAVRIRVTTAEPGFLVLADPYFPGWVARIDGVPSALLRANSLFRAVPIPPGDHTVEFRYEPWSIALGTLVSLGALLVIIAVVGAHAFAWCATRLALGRQASPAPLSESQPILS